MLQATLPQQPVKTPADENKEPSRIPDSISVGVDAAAFRRALIDVKNSADLSFYGGIPVLQCVTLTMEGPNALVVAHRGIDMSVSTTIGAVGTMGTVCVPLRTLVAFMSGADGETVEIRKAKTDERITITCGNFSAAFVGVHSEEAPILTGPGHNNPSYRRLSLAEGVMSWLLSLTLPFVSTEETRYYLNGVCLEINHGGDGKLRAIATDGHRLGTRETALTAPVERREPVIVPAKAIQSVFGLAAGKEVSFAVDDNKAEFNFGRVTIRTKLIDGTFPDWRRVVPAGPFTDLDLNVDKVTRFSRALSGLGLRSGGIARGFYGPTLKVAPHDSGIRLSARMEDVGEVAATLDTDAPDFQAFGVNNRYLSAIARAFGSKQLRVGVTGAGDPMRIVGPDSPAGEYAILMPMRI